ncbi:hypothetical protein AQJ67_10450 [Streptomyces caeruleatus]|uniref:Uncharacterized protein n=1 Tax=Streptomyces caeruleatus TaxID=661399 RepID=A0A101U5U7_9ACTN|nr:hypothetical protein AQJ67_10450 [Streptomyces caeruleatus]
MVMVVADSVGLGEHVLGARAGQGHGVVGTGRGAGAQVAAEEEDGQPRPTLGGDRWWLGTKGNAGYGRLLNEGKTGETKRVVACGGRAGQRIRVAAVARTGFGAGAALSDAVVRLVRASVIRASSSACSSCHPCAVRARRVWGPQPYSGVPMAVRGSGSPRARLRVNAVTTASGVWGLKAVQAPVGAGQRGVLVDRGHVVPAVPAQQQLGQLLPATCASEVAGSGQDVGDGRRLTGRHAGVDSCRTDSGQG